MTALHSHYDDVLEEPDYQDDECALTVEFGLMGQLPSGSRPFTRLSAARTFQAEYESRPGRWATILWD